MTRLETLISTDCSDKDIEESANEMIEYINSKTGTPMTKEEEEKFITGFNVGGQAVRNRILKNLK